MDKLLRKNPASFYDSTDLLLVSHRTAIPRSIMKGDVELLLNTFLAQELHTFRSFETVWKQLNFDHIHFACLLKDNRHAFMNVLYDIIFDHFSINLDPTKFGVIYSLYFLFITQPTTWPIQGIRVDQARWSQLFDFYIYCCRLESKEAAQAAMIFRRLKGECAAFIFTADHSFDTLNVLEKKEKAPSLNIIEGYRNVERQRFENEATLTCYNSSTNDLQSLAKQYQKAKKRACMTPQAFLGTQHWIKNTMNIHETNQTRLQNVMLKNILTMKDVAFGKSVAEAGRRMWASRADHGAVDIDVMQPHCLPSRIRPQQDATDELNEDHHDDSQEE